MRTSPRHSGCKVNSGFPNSSNPHPFLNKYRSLLLSRKSNNTHSISIQHPSPKCNNNHQRHFPYSNRKGSSRRPHSDKAYRINPHF